MKRLTWTGGLLVLLVLLTLGLRTAGERGYLLPGWIPWEERVLTPDTGPDQIILQNRRVQVRVGERLLWESDRSCPVQDLLWCDIDHDEAPELLLLTWRRGRFGESRPFWVKKDPQTWSQHLDIYQWTGEGLRPVWMASHMGLEALCWDFAPNSRLVITDRSGAQTAWDWLSWGLERIPLEQQLTAAALGDNLIHYQIYDDVLRNQGGRFDGLFDGLRETLAPYDLCSINQESVLTDRPEQYSSFPLLACPMAVGEAVVQAGFDVVTCANNHCLDLGPEGLERTTGFFRERDVICPGTPLRGEAGAQPWELVERNGITCALFAYTAHTNGHPLPEDAPCGVQLLEDREQIRQDLLAAGEQADAVLVYVHWGTEYAPEPDESQRSWAALFADCGVQVVIGTHPHVLQPVEWVGDTLVFYSLGNFISAQTGEACQHGGLGTFTLTKTESGCRVTDWALLPLVTTVENGHYTTRLE